MELRPLAAEEAAVRRFVEELWLPFHRDLQAVVENYGLADGVDLVAEEVAFRIDLLESESHRAWIAVDGADLAGFVTTDIEEAPPVFDRPDRLIVGDLYVREPYRGTSLASELMERAAERAREAGCPEMALDVDVDNGRAIAFYEKLGFETRRRRMAVDVDGL